MSVAVMSAFFALLALVALAGATAAIVVLVAGARARALRAVIARAAEPAAAAVMITATLGSLYYSEIVGFVPCQLCWFQRIFAYPLAVVFLVAVVRRWRRSPDDAARPAEVWAYTLPLAVLGLGVSAWHVAIQRLPGLDTGTCDASAPCTAVYVDQFGIISIPVMAGAAFAFVVTWGTVASLPKGGAVEALPPAQPSARSSE